MKINTIEQLEVVYIRPSRTIEKLKLSNSKKETYYIYNYDGNHYRLFENKKALGNFFKYGNEPIISFENEFDLDQYLLLREIKT